MKPVVVLIGIIVLILCIYLTYRFRVYQIEKRSEHLPGGHVVSPERQGSEFVWVCKYCHEENTEKRSFSGHCPLE